MENADIPNGGGAGAMSTESTGPGDNGGNDLSQAAARDAATEAADKEAAEKVAADIEAQRLIDEAAAKARADKEAAAAKADEDAAAARPLRTDGPTLAEYVDAGYPADSYPPRGYAPVTAEMRASGAMSDRDRLADLEARVKVIENKIKHTF